jgi:spore coat protein CotH
LLSVETIALQHIDSTIPIPNPSQLEDRMMFYWRINVEDDIVDQSMKNNISLFLDTKCFIYLIAPYQNMQFPVRIIVCAVSML